MSDAEISSIAIVGGGTAGWTTAAALAEALGPRAACVQVIETPHRGADTGALREVEASLPDLRAFHARLGFDEDELVRRAGASFGLGSAFADWSTPGAAYIHPWGEIGASFDTLGFQHAWLRARGLGRAGELGDYAMAAAAARLGRFARPVGDRRSVDRPMTTACTWTSAAMSACCASGRRRAASWRAGARSRRSPCAARTASSRR